MYSWGSMFAGSQNVPGMKERNFVGGLIRIIIINFKQMIVYKFMVM